jgi:hypothetical protein
MYDFEHVIKFSAWLDTKIFFKTIGLVLRGSGINTDGHATFLHLSDFLIEKKIKTPEEIEKVRQEAIIIEKENMKVVPMGIIKEDFKAKRREIQKKRKSYTPNQVITWD